MLCRRNDQGKLKGETGAGQRRETGSRDRNEEELIEAKRGETRGNEARQVKTKAETKAVESKRFEARDQTRANQASSEKYGQFG